MNKDTKVRYVFWKVAVVVLIILAGVQTAVIYYALNRKGNSRVEQFTQEDAILRPRLNFPMQNSQPVVQQTQSMVNASPQVQSLQPPPLPKLNIDPNNMPGIRPSPQVAQQQAQSPAMQPNHQRMNMPRAFNMPQLRMGMGGHLDIREEFERMQKMMDSMFGNQGMSAAMNRHAAARGLSMREVAPTLKDEGSNYVVKLTIPGLDKSEINAEVNNNILTLSGVQKEETEDNSQYGRSYSSSSSSFRNSFSLPGPIKSEGMKVDYNNNILTVIVPKA